MKCQIYRSSVRDGLYVYVADGKTVESLPDPVRKQLGQAELAMTLILSPERRLGQEDPRKVLDNLASLGYHVQMPRDIESVMAGIAADAQARTGQA